MELRMKPWSLVLLFLLLDVSLFPRPWAAEAIEEKCSACIGLTMELVDILGEEKHNRQPLDMRHQLDAQGKKHGRVIPYSISELRAEELLSSLCPRMARYSLMPGGDGKLEWVEENPEAEKTSHGKMVAEQQGKELTRWCDKYMEEQEEELTRMLREGQLNLFSSLEDILCRDMTDSCPPFVPEEEAAGDGDGQQGAGEWEPQGRAPPGDLPPDDFPDLLPPPPVPSGGVPSDDFPDLLPPPPAPSGKVPRDDGGESIKEEL